MEVSKLVIGISLIVPGALMIADGVLGKMGNAALFFDGINSNFEFIVGYALVILGASQIDSKKKK